MEIEKNIETMMACRFCPMCRHICTIGNISKFESNFPRGRAMNIFGVHNGTVEYDEGVINTIYNCCLCGLCKSHCLGEIYELPELIKNARKDIVDLKKEPVIVKKIRNSLVENNNPFGSDKKDAFKVSGKEKADILYYMGAEVNFKNHEIAKAVLSILDKAKVNTAVLNDETDCGKVLSLLGYEEDAKKKAEDLYARIKETGCKSIVVSCPLCYDAFKNDYPEWGFELEPSIKIYHTSEYINELVKNKKIKISKTDKKVTLSDSEYLGVFNDVFEPQRELIRSAAAENFIEMRKSGEDLLVATGEAAFIFQDKEFGADEELGRKIDEMAGETDADTIITLSARAKNIIGEVSDLNVIDVSEFISELI